MLAVIRAPQITGISYDRGLASFNINHSFVASGTYQLPIGSGKAFLSDLHGPAQLLLGGWIANGILTLNSGPPQYIPCQITTTATTGTCYANVVPGVTKYRSGGPAHYYNPAAFTDPPVATTIGNSNLAPLGGSNTQVNGPGFRDLDFSIFKEFGVTETTRLQFRAEAFNLTNTPSFNLPSNQQLPGYAEFWRVHHDAQQPARDSIRIEVLLVGARSYTHPDVSKGSMLVARGRDGVSGHSLRRDGSSRSPIRPGSCPAGW